MEYICSACRGKVGDLVLFKEHTEQHIINLVKHDHPEWTENNGLCPRCAEYYRSEMRGSTFKDVPCALRNRKIKMFWNKFTEILRVKK